MLTKSACSWPETSDLFVAGTGKSSTSKGNNYNFATSDVQMHFPGETCLRRRFLSGKW